MARAAAEQSAPWTRPATAAALSALVALILASAAAVAGLADLRMTSAVAIAVGAAGALLANLFEGRAASTVAWTAVWLSAAFVAVGLAQALSGGSSSAATAFDGSIAGLLFVSCVRMARAAAAPR
jgi:hypothetical protein